MSHLPEPIVGLLTGLAQGLEEALQATAHVVDTAVEVHPSFDQGWVHAPMVRALLRDHAIALADDTVGIVALANGGFQVSMAHEDVRYLFRARRGARGQDGALEIRVSSDSILAASGGDPQLSLFDSPDLQQTSQQWILAYFLTSERTFAEVYAARVVGKVEESPPFRLRLANITAIEHEAPLPPSFQVPHEDLDLGEADEGEDQDDSARG